jgi:uncharacterized protein (TIGR02453 family)
MSFSGFPKEGLAFLSEIIINNSKAWLDANRDTYEATIVRPNKAYVEEMGEYLQILVPNIKAIPNTNQSLFRIYRDARFHLSDPIKSRIGVICWQGAGHRMQSSSFYMHYDPFEVFVSAGVRNFKPTLLKTYREYIQNEQRRTELHNIFENMKSKGYFIPEPKYKRMPRGCSTSDSHSYLYLMGACYAYTTYTPDETFHSAKVLERHFNIYKEMFALQQWVYELTLHCDTSADVFR